MRKAGSRITPECWEKLLESYRARPNVHAAAATAASVDWMTAKKAWEKGNRGFAGGMPIKQLLEEEKLGARAAIQAELRRERDEDEARRKDARKQAITARGQEGMMVQLSRVGAVKLLQAVNQAAKSVSDLGGRAQAKLDALLKEDDMARLDPDLACKSCGHPRQMPLGEVVGLVAQMATLMGRCTALAKEAMVLERMHLGAPTEVTEVQVTSKVDHVTTEDAVERLKAATAAVESAARRGILAPEKKEAN